MKHVLNVGIQHALSEFKTIDNEAFVYRSTFNPDHFLRKRAVYTISKSSIHLKRK